MAAREQISAALDGNPQRFEWQHRRLDGTLFDSEVSLNTVRLSTGPHLLAFVRDVTERKQAETERERLEAQLRQSQKMEAVGQLAGGVAHDFNNILTAILGNMEMSLEGLKAKLGADEPLLRGLGEVEESAQRAAALTRQLLMFSRRDVARPVPLDFNQVVTIVEKMLRRLMPENIALQIDLAPDVHSVLADAGQIEQVIINLAVNARDAMREGGSLAIETGNVALDDAYVAAHAEASTGPHVTLTVSDTGRGMDAGTMERIFEPFFTTKPPGEGTGLGLSTVYGIVKQGGGHITVCSEPGQGTTFTVYLPVVEATAIRPEERAAADEAPTGTETILVCEDHKMVRELTERSLRGAGYAVLAASNGLQALEAAEQHSGLIDLLVTDVVMPDMDGKKLADALAAGRPDLKTLFVSGYTGETIAHRGLLDEGVELLEKPFNRCDLLRRVREVLDKAGSTRR